MQSTTTATKQPARKPRAPAVRMTLEQVMRELELAGSAQTRKTYLRHGCAEPLFGVSFATLKGLHKRIGVDHPLAVALWDTGNYDARNLAGKIADPAQFSPTDLSQWVAQDHQNFCSGYAALIAAEGPHGIPLAEQWLGCTDTTVRCAGWVLFSQLAARDETLPDPWFSGRLDLIARTIASAPNAERDAMNRAVIAIGGRNEALRQAATAAAGRIGKVHVDYGDTGCKTPDAAQYIEKTWVHAAAKGFESPAAQERSRDYPRQRC